MDFAASHAGYVLAAYAASAIVLTALAAGIYARSRRTARLLDALEAEGAPRRARGVRP